MTPREFQALEEVYLQRRREWALERAHFANAHLNADGVGWTVEDFLGGGNREARAAEVKMERFMAKRATDRENQRAMNPLPDDIPLWAIQAKEADDRQKEAMKNGK